MNRVEINPPVNQEINPSPVYIKLETEDFAGVDMNDNTAAWQQNMSWHPQWSRGGSSGWWGVRGIETASRGTLTKEIYVPRDGEYTLWLRYQDYFGKAEPFSVVIDYSGGTAKADYGLKDMSRQPDPKTMWSYAWDKKLSN